MSAVERIRAETEREIALGYVPAERADEYRARVEKSLAFAAAAYHDALVEMGRRIVAPFIRAR